MKALQEGLNKYKMGLLRIIDVNLNRVREGLRVCEDIARFIINDKDIAKKIKSMRHRASAIIIYSENLSFNNLLFSRNTKRDPMKFTDFKKKNKKNLDDIFLANIQRVKESLRVLEESCNIIDEGLGRKYRRLRFGVYEIEKRVFKKNRPILYS